MSSKENLNMSYSDTPAASTAVAAPRAAQDFDTFLELPSFTNNLSRSSRVNWFWSLWWFVTMSEAATAMVMVVVGASHDHPEGYLRQGGFFAWMAFWVLGILLQILAMGFFVGYKRQMQLFFRPRRIGQFLLWWVGFALGLVFAMAPLGFEEEWSYGESKRDKLMPLYILSWFVSTVGFTAYALSYRTNMPWSRSKHASTTSQV